MRVQFRQKKTPKLPLRPLTQDLVDSGMLAVSAELGPLVLSNHTGTHADRSQPPARTRRLMWTVAQLVPHRALNPYGFDLEAEIRSMFVSWTEASSPQILSFSVALVF